MLLLLNYYLHRYYLEVTQKHSLFRRSLFLGSGVHVVQPLQYMQMCIRAYMHTYIHKYINTDLFTINEQLCMLVSMYVGFYRHGPHDMLKVKQTIRASVPVRWCHGDVFKVIS